MLDVHVVIGSRRSKLALWQTNFVIDCLKAAHPGLNTEVKIIVTQGDVVLDKTLPAIGGKGVFTEALEAALIDGTIDLAVHSLKDLPTESPDGLTVGAIPSRADPHDVLVSRNGYTLSTLPDGATVGTSSRRRAAQLKALRDDLRIVDIRGNVPTRIEKVLAKDGIYDAIVLAKAGVDRLELSEHVSEIISLDVMLPAPGQGALGIQCRDDNSSLALLSPIVDLNTTIAVTAERAFLNALGGGCAVPVAAHAILENDMLRLQGRVSSLDGKQMTHHERSAHINGDVQLAQALGRSLAEDAIHAGAADILGAVQ